VRLFVSHASRDQRAAEALKYALRTRGITAVTVSESHSPGAWRNRIHEEISRSAATIALVSEDFLTRGWCHQEVGMAAALRHRLLRVDVAGFTPPGADALGMLQDFNPMRAAAGDAWLRIAERLETEIGADGELAHQVLRVTHPDRHTRVDPSRRYSAHGTGCLENTKVCALTLGGNRRFYLHEKGTSSLGLDWSVDEIALGPSGNPARERALFAARVPQGAWPSFCREMEHRENSSVPEGEAAASWLVRHFDERMGIELTLSQPVTVRTMRRAPRPD
jgi:hypothetical protein